MGSAINNLNTINKVMVFNSPGLIVFRFNHPSSGRKYIAATEKEKITTAEVRKTLIPVEKTS
jgi:hypothetical protein